MRPKLNFLVTTINAVFREESTRPMMKYTILLCFMGVDLWCSRGCVTYSTGNFNKIGGRMNECSMLSENTTGQFAFFSLEAVHEMHLDLPTWQRSKTERLTWTFSGCSNKKGRFRSCHRNPLTTEPLWGNLKLAAHARISRNLQNLVFFAKKNRKWPWPQLLHKAASCHWCYRGQYTLWRTKGMQTFEQGPS